jgi:short-subunit dehydrogenase
MKVVLADIEKGALTQTEEALQAQGGIVIAVQTDVSKAEALENLAQKTLDAFGAVHLLFNNAGVVPNGGSTVWKSQYADWEWVIGVNLWGVIHGLHTFVPIMLKQNTECHIVNTASMAGLVSYEFLVTYHVSKHAVVALSEHLYHSLAQQKAKVKASVLCPGWVKTNFLDAERNRPPAFSVHRPMTPSHVKGIQKVQSSMAENGLSPHGIADTVFAAIRANKFYIFTHPELKDMVRQRMEDILQERNPTPLEP